MLRKIQRQDLDTMRYNRCIDTHAGSKLYAHAWYLDIVTEKKWFAWVLDDYVAVCPIPLKLKMGVEWIAMPHFCQQLGVYGTQDISAFRKIIPKKKLLTYSSHHAFDSKSKKSDNYILDLNRPLHQLQKGFSRNRKAALKKAKASGLRLQREFDAQRAMDNLEASHIYSTEQKSILPKLMETLVERKAGFQLNIWQKDTCVASGFFGVWDKRIYYLFSGQTQRGKAVEAHTLMLHAVIEQFSNQPCILDFEGSMLPGVAAFFKSFGATQVPYYVHKGILIRLRSKLPF